MGTWREQGGAVKYLGDSARWGPQHLALHLTLETRKDGETRVLLKKGWREAKAFPVAFQRPVDNHQSPKIDLNFQHPNIC